MTVDRRIEIYAREGQVIWADTVAGTYNFDPNEAVNIANAILHSAADCGCDIKFEVDKPTVSDKKRLYIVRRVELVMNSMSAVKDKTKVASHIVDTILSMVL